MLSRMIRSAHIHAERGIQLSMALDFDKIWIICSYLTNFLPPLITQEPNDIDILEFMQVVCNWGVLAHICPLGWVLAHFPPWEY